MRNFTATLRFDICDDFGVDQQHARPGHHLPLLNELIADVSISGSY